jgi:RNA polymerase sigma-70 factor, ECF subfamily
MRVAWRNEAPDTRLDDARGRAQPQATTAYADWDAIYTDNVRRLYRLMYAKVGNRPDAEDLTAQIFLAAYGPLRTTASVGEVRAYLLATARTVLAAHWRQTLGHQVTVIDLAQVDLEDYAVPSAPDDAGETAAQVAKILDALPERYRAILALRFLRGYTIKQAAAELGVTVANAKVIQHRALRHAAGLKILGEPEGSVGPKESVGSAGFKAAELRGTTVGPA